MTPLKFANECSDGLCVRSAIGWRIHFRSFPPTSPPGRLHNEDFIAGGGADGYRGNVRSAIRRIRDKFRSFDPTFDKIENYNGFGYCWKKPD